VETLQTLGGYHVIQASNAAIAWIMVMKNPPDLMLVDIHLPGESGIEFMQKCKKKPELSQIPAIVVSGDSARQSVIESSKAGAVSFMVKPVTAYDLLSTVEQVLNPSEETPT
ncbi:MAG: response regulator, partial [Candidatus Poribacteria bacterium]|nr:response regulator [Candidatus Poribacteria bacterium]